jgi:hypothetical protein
MNTFVEDEKEEPKSSVEERERERSIFVLIK